jgi:uncharacterized delta-60 repeat protein
VVAAARLFLAVAILGLTIPSAAAAEAQLDPSFGEGGVVHVSPPLTPPYSSQYIEQMAAARDGSSFVLSQQTRCREERECTTDVKLFRYASNGSLDRSFGGPDGSFAVPEGFGSLALMVDSVGRPVLVQELNGGMAIRRVTWTGLPDPGFGRRGVVVIHCRCGFGAWAVAGPRGTLTLAQYPDDRGDASRPMTLYRLRSDGSLDPGFGRGGVAKLSYHAEDLRPTEAMTPDGALYFAGATCCKRGHTFYLTRVSATGRLDRRFTRTARRSLRRLEGPGGEWAAVRAVLARRGGTVDLLGRTADGKRGYEMRLNADGRPQRSFGNRGIQTSSLPINSAVLNKDGSIFTLYTEFEGRRYLSRLLPDGRRDPAFGVATLPEARGDYLLSLAPQEDRGVLVVDIGLRECPESCEDQPKLIRYLPVGQPGVR